MPPGSVEEVLALLEAGRDDDLVGLEESPWFDAKRGAYTLGQCQTHKWELAKDVSAMANATGGLILVGAKTNREQSWLEEPRQRGRPDP